MEFPDSTRIYTREEQAQLLANLDIELEHKTRQFKEWIDDYVEQYRLRSEGIISRLSKQIRHLTMAEFADKYNGDIQAAMIAMQVEKTTAETDEITRSVRKRKWEMDVDESDGSKVAQNADSLRAHKNARLGFATPSKKAGPSKGPGTAQRLKAQMARTPNASRFKGYAPSPSPTKTTRFATATTTIPNGAISHSRPASPSKAVAFGSRTTRPPSSVIFNPSMPPKTPAYPSAPRWPRKGEHLLSVDGSPLANPIWQGVSGDDKMEGPSNRPAVNGHKRVNSITILKNPALVSSKSGHSHSRTNSQTDNLSSTSKSHPLSINRPHSRTDSASAHAASSADLLPSTPAPARAMVSIPTKDGRILQFDPLEASPAMLDELEGITESAKKQARDDMAKLVRAALDKWKLD